MFVWTKNCRFLVIHRAPPPSKKCLIMQSGLQVQKGDTLLVLEAMKMEYPVMAEASGKVVEVHVEGNTLTRQGDVLLTLEVDVKGPEE